MTIKERTPTLDALATLLVSMSQQEGEDCEYPEKIARI